MKKYHAFFVVALVAFSILCTFSIARANLITNGDFTTGTLAGWQPTGDVVATNYLNIPVAYQNVWDLSTWDSRMDGYFALYYGTPSYLDMRIALGPADTPLSLSFDYAVAWAEPATPRDIGYFYVETRGVTANGIWLPLSYNEVQWAGFDFGLDKNVFTGSICTDLISHSVLYNEIAVHIYAFNPNHSLNQIIGIDNVNLSVVPVPEPGTLLLVSFGLVGLAGFGRKLKKS